MRDPQARQAVELLREAENDPVNIQTLTADLTMVNDQMGNWYEPGSSARRVIVPAGLRPGTAIHFHRPSHMATLRVVPDYSDSQPVVIQTPGGGGGGANSLERGTGTVMIDSSGDAILFGDWVTGDHAGLGTRLADLRPRKSLQTESAGAVSQWDSVDSLDSFTQPTGNNQPTVDTTLPDNDRPVVFAPSASWGKWMSNARTSISGNGLLVVASMQNLSAGGSSTQIDVITIEGGGEAVRIIMGADGNAAVEKKVASGAWTGIFSGLSIPSDTKEPIIVVAVDWLNDEAYLRTNFFSVANRMTKVSATMPDLSGVTLGTYRLGNISSGSGNGEEASLYGVLVSDNIPTDGPSLADLVERGLGWGVAQQNVGVGVIE